MGPCVCFCGGCPEQKNHNVCKYALSRTLSFSSTLCSSVVVQVAPCFVDFQLNWLYLNDSYLGEQKKNTLKVLFQLLLQIKMTNETVDVKNKGEWLNLKNIRTRFLKIYSYQLSFFFIETYLSSSCNTFWQFNTCMKYIITRSRSAFAVLQT